MLIEKIGRYWIRTSDPHYVKVVALLSLYVNRSNIRNVNSHNIYLQFANVNTINLHYRIFNVYTHIRTDMSGYRRYTGGQKENFEYRGCQTARY